MRIDEAAILLNCHTFQDFPVHGTCEEADSLLASWTVLWHPRSIAHTGRMPLWYRADAPPVHDRPRLLILPRSQAAGSTELLAKDIEHAGGRLIEQTGSIATILDEVVAWMTARPTDGPTDGGEATDGAAFQSEIDWSAPWVDDLAADFMALGYAYLQIELLTRHMRYSTHLGETAFAQNLVSAAQALASGNGDETRRLLQTCFDFLSQERDHYYAVDIYLVDISLMRPDIVGAPLRSQLQDHPKTNLLLTAEMLSQMAEREPDSVTTLRRALDDGRAALIGGEYAWWPLHLLSTETAREQLTAGRDLFQQLVGRVPRVYGRHRSGLNPSLPPLLLHYGFTGALHATFDGGRFPEATQSKSRWEGDGTCSIDAIMRAPLDASQSTTFLRLATSLSESMDMDHIATRCLVHWTGATSPWYAMLQRVTRYTRALGRFVTIEEYFQETYDPGLHDRFSSDDYRSPYLTEQVEQRSTRPISAISEAWRHAILLQHWQQLATLRCLVDPHASARSDWQAAQQCVEQWHRQPLDSEWPARFADVTERMQATARELLEAMHRAQRGNTGTNSAQPITTATTSGPQPWAIINPLSFPRRVGPIVCRERPAPEAPVYAVDGGTSTPAAVVDVPAFGIVSPRGPSNTSRFKKPKSAPPMAEGTMVRNEFFEAHIDAQTGALRALRNYGSRSARMSQQLAYRWVPQGSTPASSNAPNAVYSTMVADEVRCVHGDALSGHVESRGVLRNDKQEALARFVQHYRVQRGSRVLTIDVEIEPLTLPEGSPWDNYYAARFAWSNEASDLARSLVDGRRPTKASRFEAPLFVQLDDGHERTVILTGGNAFHRRAGTRMLDTLLIVRGEQQRRFTIGIAVDPKQPFREAIGLLAPTIQVPLTQPLAHDSAWLFHVDARHVLVTSWAPLWEDDRVVGVRIRLVEVEGRSGQVSIRAFRPWVAARKIDAVGQTAQYCELDQDACRFAIGSHELLEIEGRFVKSASDQESTGASDQAS